MFWNNLQFFSIFLWLGVDVFAIITTAENDNLELNLSIDGIKEGEYCNIFVKDDCKEFKGSEISLTIGTAPKVYIPKGEIDEYTK